MNRLGILKKRRRRNEFLRRRRAERAIRNWVPTPPVEEVPFIQERIYPEYPEYPPEEEEFPPPPPEHENEWFKL